MSRSIFSNTKLALTTAVDTTVSIFSSIDTASQALNNVASVGLIASTDWRKQAEFESQIKDVARTKILNNKQAIAAIEEQILTQMIGNYIPETQSNDLFALPSSKPSK